MKKILCIVYLMANTAFATDCPSISSELSSLIKSHAQEIKGREYCEYRTVNSLNEMEIALYSIEGPCFKKEGREGSCGNMHFRYLAGIVNGNLLPPFEVGKRGSFSANDMEIINENIIYLKGFKYTENDPMCCPSIEESKIVKITDAGFEFKHP